MVLLIVLNLILTVIALSMYFFFGKENKFNVSIKESDKPLFLFVSLVPFVNISVITSSMMVFIPAYSKYKMTNENKLNKMNQFIKCNSCEVVYRNGYKKDNTCPICNEITGHIKIKDESFKSSKIPEHVKFKKNDIKTEKMKSKKNKLKENESLYEEVKTKSLEKKKTML